MPNTYATCEDGRRHLPAVPDPSGDEWRNALIAAVWNALDHVDRATVLSQVESVLEEVAHADEVTDWDDPQEILEDDLQSPTN